MIRFCPSKILSDSFRSFYTRNTQNLKESERIYKGQKRITKGFLELTLLASLAKMRLFWAVFKHCGNIGKFSAGTHFWDTQSPLCFIIFLPRLSGTEEENVRAASRWSFLMDRPDIYSKNGIINHWQREDFDDRYAINAWNEFRYYLGWANGFLHFDILSVPKSFS